MKHESINTVIAGLALLLGILSAISQLRPKSDDLIVSSGSISFSESLLDIKDGNYAVGAEYDAKLIGPVVWKLDLVNTRDRNLVITDIKAFKLDSANGRSYYTSLFSFVSLEETGNKKLVTPLNIPNREGIRLLLGLNIAIPSDDRSTGNCIVSGITLLQLQRCLFASGRDLFGNPYKATFFTDSGERVGFDMPVDPTDPILENAMLGEFANISDAKFPKFLIEITSSDGSKFSETLHYYPFN